jgi:hypothetical protein
MLHEPRDMVPPTLELARGRIIGFAVLAIAGSVVFGVALYDAIGRPKVWPGHMPPRAAITLRNLHHLADEGFPLWRQAHPLDACPRAIEDVAAYTNDADIRGPYGGSATYTFTCDPARMPSGVHGIWIRDLGADEVVGTADDYSSDMEGTGE